MTRSLAGRVAALLLLAIALVLPAPAAAKVKPVYMVGLGDSLSRGVQDDGMGTSILTNRGYNDVLYAQLRNRIPNLKLVKLGCPGESTTSYLTGKGNVAGLDCKPNGGSQGNIHANDAGYRLMAATFRKALGSFSVPVPK